MSAPPLVAPPPAAQPPPAGAASLPQLRFDRLWPRLRAWARHGWRWARAAVGWVPLTPLGLLTVVLLVWMMRTFGIARKDMVLLAVALGGLALVGGSVLFVAATGLWLRFARGPRGQEWLSLEAGSPCRTGYLLGRITWNPLVNVGLTWETPPGLSVRLVATWEGLAEEITPSERALCGDVVRRFTLTDILGLARLSFRRREAREVEIRPACGRVPALPLLPQTVAGDDREDPEGCPQGDLNEMRQYGPGDPLRLVLWKVYARTGQLLVRAPERSVAHSERTMAYLVAGEGDEAAAGIARTALEAGLLGTDFVFAAGEGSPARSGREAIDQVVRSVNTRDRAGTGLEALLTHGAGEGLKTCILFVPGVPGAWLDDIVSILGRRPGPFRVLIGVDGISSHPLRHWLRRLLLKETQAPGAPAEGVRRVFEALSPVAAEVWMLDRFTGETILPQ